MSALGHKLTCAAQQPMSALHLIATAKADMSQMVTSALRRKRTCAVQLVTSALTTLLRHSDLAERESNGLLIFSGCTDKSCQLRKTKIWIDV